MLTPVTPNPITTSTTIKSHGSESRTAPGHNTVEAQVLPQASGHSGGVGLDAGTILANVNAEAATAGNRTILQTLALAVAAQLNIVRRNDETMEAFFLRIAAALDEMTPDEREATELQAGLKLLKIQIPALSAALKQSDSALAARLSAMAEAPLATPQKTAAAAATTSYLQEAPGVSRAAETLAMVTQARSNADGSGIFSSTPTPAVPEKQPSDARSLQTQLKTLFEPGVAETRIEIATKEEPANVLILDRNGDDPQAPVALRGAMDAEQAHTIATTAAEQSAQVDEQPVEKQVDARQTDAGAVDVEPADAMPAEARQADPKPVGLRQAGARPLEAKLQDAKLLDAKQPDARPTDAKSADIRQAEARPLLLTKAESTPALAPETPVPQSVERRPEPKMPGLPAPQNNNYPNATSMLRAIARELVREKFDNGPDFGSRREDGDHRMQTMLTLKGIAEVITAMPSKAAEFLMSPQLVADIKAKQARANANLASTPGDAAARAGEAEAPISEGAAVRKGVTMSHHSTLPSSAVEDATEEQARLATGHADAKAQSATRNMEPGSTAAVKTAGGSLDPVPFAFAALQPAKEEFKAEAAEERGRHEDEDEGEDADGEEREDPEARRERLARKATDDLLRPEPAVDPEVKITRDSSQADRAYALYQRMAGF